MRASNQSVSSFVILVLFTVILTHNTIVSNYSVNIILNWKVIFLYQKSMTVMALKPYDSLHYMTSPIIVIKHAISWCTFVVPWKGQIMSFYFTIYHQQSFCPYLIHGWEIWLLIEQNDCKLLSATGVKIYSLTITIEVKTVRKKNTKRRPKVILKNFFRG